VVAIGPSVLHPTVVVVQTLGQFFADGHTLTDLSTDPLSAQLDEVIGVHDAATELLKAGSDFAAHPEMIIDLVAAIKSSDALVAPIPPDVLKTPSDPLCPAP
jgi:hypothetical protein